MPNKVETNITSAVYQKTPSVKVYSNQGLLVRTLDYYRAQAEQAAEIRISLQRFNTTAQLKSSYDPRLSATYLRDNSSVPNQQQITTLQGVILQTKNVDAGMRISIVDCRGQPLWNIDSLATKQEFDYDVLRRVTAIYEKVDGKSSLCRERFLYDDKQTTKGNNLIHRLWQCYDTAGLQTIKGYSLFGALLKMERQFVANHEAVDWPEQTAEKTTLLEETAYTTTWQYNGLDEIITQTDAQNNLRSFAYNIAGQLSVCKLQIAQGPLQTIVDRFCYAADGQLQTKRLGNGVHNKYVYEEKTQRLQQIRSLRQQDQQLLQDLNYHYDPVGNIIGIIDRSQAIRFYANDKTQTSSKYHYDSLYQLIIATGIESQQSGKATSQLPVTLPLGNTDANRCVNYTRSYQYDAGGNLYRLQHRGAQTYSRELQIAANSNRGIEKRESGPTLQESFDGNGNLLYLNADQPLIWDSRNQLQQIIQIKREDKVSDEENYRYNGGGQRVEKYIQRLTETQLHTDRIRYLPGLEIREYWQTDVTGNYKKITEQLTVITTEVENTSIRVLHWQTGKPAEIDNNVLRYTLSDHLGSCQLELSSSAEIISYENYYPYGGTALWSTKNQREVKYKFIRYSGKERDATGLYYYGYRYYLPWLGRWLNPDPSGIVDGLNLYRMAKNNPITFYDSEGMNPITTNYQATRGDLLYGLNSLRARYINKLFPNAKSKHEIPPLVIDIYNNEIAYAVAKENPNYFQALNEGKQPEAIDITIKIPENLKDTVSQAIKGNYKFLWDEYFSISSSSKKFNIEAIYQETSQKYGYSMYHKWNEQLPQGTQLLSKRGSKLGIEIVARSEQLKLHFILDELNLENTVSKSGWGQYISHSELRYIYRNWERLEGKVHFYRNYLEVEPPWKENSSLWNSYKPLIHHAQQVTSEIDINAFLEDIV